MRGDGAVREGDLKGAGILVGRITRVVTGAGNIDSSDDAVGPSDHEGIGRAIRQCHMRDAREEDDKSRRRRDGKRTDSI